MSEAITTKNKSDNQDDDTNIEDYDEAVVNDFPTMIKELFGNIPWKLSALMFLLLLVLFSKQFIEGILNPLGRGTWVDGDCPTTVGTGVLCIFAALGLIIIDLLIRAKVL